MSLQHALIAILADGEFHSGTALGQHLDVSRNAVWKALQHLQALDIDVHAVHGKGYRLAEPLELLDSQGIESLLSEQSRNSLHSLDVLFDVDSTNAWLLRQPRRHAVACLAERQHSGRGRRGRDWISPFAANLYLSMGWQFETSASSLGSMSLVVGVAIVRGLQALGIEGLSLKWPNDIYCQGRKLGGILIEMRGESGGPSELVIGVGINIHMPTSVEDSITQPWIDLRHCHGVSRNRVAASVIDALVDACLRCSEGESSQYLQEWERLNEFAGQTVVLHMPDGKTLEGRCTGIDENGALLLEHNGATQSFHCGEVSLRGT